ncbi:Uncharacterised protein [Burkholderia pseudomallei]|nr:Uncharacterised protein [Burkholderia pseudomallei]CAJ4735751.1 Uncharacterised protein [Burkholderia pseudomallei]CAJ5842210.1 Uncharacterised protein [Burkholderia pseudomallei]VBI67202.1 Uncharacterised protein [Burkholderia pseudomallei]
MPVECRRAAPAGAREPPPPDANGTPPTVISPSSGACRPARSLTSVDLPAPFWPISPCTVPRVTASDAPRSAATPPKRLTTRRTSTACVAPTCGMSHAAQIAEIAPFGYFCSNWLICAYAFCAVFGITSRSSGSMIFTFGYHFSTAFSWS